MLAVRYIIDIVNFLLLLIILIMILIKNHHYQYKTLRYLLWGVFSLIVAYLSGSAIEVNDIDNLIFSLSTFFLSLFIGLYFFLLFFEAFEYENPMTKQNMIIGAILIFSGTTILITSLPLAYILQLKGHSIALLFSPHDLDIGSKFIFGGFIISLIISILLIFVLVLLLGRKLVRRYQLSTKPEAKKVLREMIITLFNFIIIPSIVIFVVPVYGYTIANLVMTLGIGLFFFFYLRGGVFLFQSESLRHLIIINDAGIPLYQHSFTTPKNSNETESNEEGVDIILFSGALKAISSLLKEFTGVDQEVKEIRLANTYLIIKSISDSLSCVLITDKSTKFFNEALTRFSKKLQKVAENIVPEIVPDDTVIKEIDDLVENLFGYGQFHIEIGQLYSEKNSTKASVEQK